MYLKDRSKAQQICKHLITTPDCVALRMNGIMNELTAQDEDYQSLIKKADKCTYRLDDLNLTDETRELIDRYASE